MISHCYKRCCDYGFVGNLGFREKVKGMRLRIEVRVQIAKRRCIVAAYLA